MLLISIIVVLHELGHFTMAKAFNVYCLEFSVGMGPALISRKRKNGETKFSFRAIPFGGYVSMLSEGVELEEGVNIDPSRSVEGIKKWKKAIIFSAGVIMNFITGLIIFFIAAWIPQQKIYNNAVTLYKAPESYPTMQLGTYIYEVETLGSGVFGIDKSAIVHFDNGEVKNDVIAAVSYGSFTFKDTAISTYLGFYLPMTNIDDEGNEVVYISKENEVNISKVDYVEFSFSIISMDENDNKVVTPVPVKVHKYYDEKKEQYFYEDTGFKAYTNTVSPKNMGEALKQTFRDFGDGATIVVTSLKSLLTDTKTWNDAGGIVAVGFVTSSTLNNLGWSYFLYYWAVIAVNLGIINILPFPGLDGWHLLVTAIEGITRKRIPTKVKNIFAIVGMGLLFLLMIVLLFKDVFKFIFNIGLLFL